MKPLRHALTVAIVCAVAAALTSGAQERRPTRAAPADPNARRSESLREFAERLAAENVRLEALNESLRSDNEALRRQVEETEKALRRFQENGGILRFVPRDPQAPGAGQQTVPPNWIPRKFNGGTYYIVPLASDRNAALAPAARPAAQSRPQSRD